MSGHPGRKQAIDAVTRYKAPPADPELDLPPGEIFGVNVFSRSVMQQRLPKSVYKSVLSTMEDAAPLDPTVADVIASAMKDWAMEKGATHYAHVFYPLTGLTAEKHDSFLEPDGSGASIAEFAGKTLIQGEPDASSFPKGGLRQTFEARGYTAWDVTSEAYILENPSGNTLCIPTVFVSWTGEALDKKTPLLRSQQALNTQTQRVLRLFGHEDVSAVSSFAGAEQEYFLVDRHFFFARPDLMSSGRTLFGAPAPKGQEFDDHYFGAIPERVLGFMLDAERELFKLGIPAKTRHNEVAPAQFELAPVFEKANIATDHQQLLMETLKRVASRHGMECLLHEKPFARVNGSGKHVNFSLGNSTQGNLLNPGDTPHENAQFLVFCAAVIRSVDLYSGLLRAVVASASNDHRLGANEAPPAIISIFLGEQLADVFDQVAKGGATQSREKGTLLIGVDTLPALPSDPGDRNRTSPFAFTGNRFEFRAPGSMQSIAGPMVSINTMMADSLDFIATEIESSLDSGVEFNTAVQKVLEEIITAHGRVVFNGDGYSEQWAQEAQERGLKNLRTTVDALPELVSEEVLDLFARYDVLDGRELHSRYEVYLEQYHMKVSVEARTTLEMSRTIVLPAAIRYQGDLASTAASMAAAGLASDTGLLERVTESIAQLSASIEVLDAAMEAAPSDGELECSVHACESVIPAMDAVRQSADEFESLIADDLWPLPTYQE
ncbi:MAG: glutamine synthetase III, partial [Microthrixaceae bacterium]